ncbi:MAG: hypothetical protein KDK65_01275 [Chlamydiia bacterium]|nr:hypothetical protein [Chlamydiia bacterium]
MKRYQQEGDRTFSLYVLNSAFKNKQQIPSDIASFLVQHMDENMAQQDQIWFKEAHDKTFPLHGERLLEMISAGNLDEAKAKVSAAISLDISKEHCESIVAQLDRKQDESKELIKAIINHQHVPLESLLYLCHRFDLDPPQRRYTVYCIRTSGVPVAFVQKHLTVLGLEPALIHLVKIDALDALKAYQNDGGKTFPYSLVIDALNTNNSRKPNKAIVDFLKQHMNEQNLQDFERDYLEKRYKQLFSGQ